MGEVVVGLQDNCHSLIHNCLVQVVEGVVGQHPRHMAAAKEVEELKTAMGHLNLYNKE